MFERFKKWLNTNTRYYQTYDGSWVVQRYYGINGWSDLDVRYQCEEQAILSVKWWQDFDQEYEQRIAKKQRFIPEYKYL